MKALFTTLSLIALLTVAFPAVPCKAQGQDNDPSFEDLVRQLGDKDPAVRSKALGVIGSLQLYPDKAAPLIIKALDDPVFSVRADAAGSLGNLAHAIPDLDVNFPGCVARLKELLNDHDPQDVHRIVQMESIYALGHIGAASESAVPLLLNMATDPEVTPNRRADALQAVGGIGRTSKGMPSEQTIETLIRLLDDPQSIVSSRACQALGEFGTRAKLAEPILLARLKSQEPQQRGAASLALGAVGFGSPEAEAALLDRLDDPDPRVQQTALRSLEGINETYAFFFRNNSESREISEKRQALLTEISNDPARRGRFVQLLRAQFRLGDRRSPRPVETLRRLRELKDRDSLPLFQKRFAEMEKKVTMLETADLRLQLLRAIAEFLPPNEVVPFLITVDSDNKEAPQVRFRAAVMLCASGDPEGVAHVLNTYALIAGVNETDALPVAVLTEAFAQPKLFESEEAFKNLAPPDAEELDRIHAGIQLAQRLFNSRGRDAIKSVRVRKIQVEEGKVKTIEFELNAGSEGWGLKIHKVQQSWVPCEFKMIWIT